jgi:hypothetical protein
MFFIWPTECMYLQQSIGLMLLNVSKVDHHYFMHPHVGLLGLKLFAHESDKSWKLLIETKKNGSSSLVNQTIQFCRL